MVIHRKDVVNGLVSEPTCRLPADNNEIEALVAAHKAEQEGQQFDRRRGPRHQFGDRITMHLEHPGGGKYAATVYARDLSALGLGVVHTGYLHVGTLCSFELSTLWGVNCTVEGAIVRCEHLKGAMHLAGVMFFEPIELSDYIDDADTGAPPQQLAQPKKEITGRALLVDDQEFEADLLRHHLRETGVEMEHCHTSAEAIEFLQQNLIDVLICDLDLETESGEETIRKIRGSGFSNAIIALSGEWTRRRLTGAREAGAQLILPKPYDPNKLLGEIAKNVDSRSDHRSETPVRSRLASDPKTVPILKKFIAQCQEITKELEEAISEGDVTGARRRCAIIREGSGGYGFERLSVAANEAMVALDASQSTIESLGALRFVVSLAGRLEC